MTATHPHTVASAAHHLGISLRTMQRRIAAGEVDAVKVHTSKGRGYEWRIRLDGDATVDVAPPAPSTATAVAPAPGQMTAMPSDNPAMTDTTLVLGLVGELVRERDRLVRENERLRAAVQSRRRWWRFWERGA